MLLFDQTKALEKALGAEAAEVIAKIFEGQHEVLASKTDLEAKLRELELRLKYDLTLRIGAMLAGAVAIIGVMIRVLGN